MGPFRYRRGCSWGDPTNLTASVPRLPIYLAQATGYHPTLETISAQLLLIALYAVAGVWVIALARRRRRNPTVPITNLAQAPRTP